MECQVRHTFYPTFLFHDLWSFLDYQISVNKRSICILVLRLSNLVGFVAFIGINSFWLLPLITFFMHSALIFSLVYMHDSTEKPSNVHLEGSESSKCSKSPQRHFYANITSQTCSLIIILTFWEISEDHLQFSVVLESIISSLLWN